MSLLLLTNPPTSLTNPSQWTDFVIRENASNIGTGLSIPIFTLTNWDTSAVRPEIKQGSIIEVGGALYQADADTALTDDTGLVDGTVHIKLVPEGGGASVAPTLTNDSIPAWDGNKGGWYDASEKFLPYEMTLTSTAFTCKSEYINQNKTIKIGIAGDISGTNVSTQLVEVDTISEKTASAGVSFPNTVKWKYYYSSSSITSGALWDILSPWVPIDQDGMAIYGQANIGGVAYIFTALYRYSSVLISLLGTALDVSPSATYRTFDTSGTDTWTNVELMSNFDSV